MKQSIGWLILWSVGAASSLSAADYLQDRTEVESLLAGATLNGIYLRTQSPYTLEFRKDGTLVNPSGDQGRWWVNAQGQYCREWVSGRLAGNQACLDLSVEGETIAMYSSGKKVAEGRLVRD